MSGLDSEYIKYLIGSQVNYTQSYMGAHHDGLSHDKINRFMRGKKFRPRHLWQAVRDDVEPHADGYIVFDDTTLDKRYSEKIEVAQIQYSGASHGMVMGINIVTCLYVNPELDCSWVIDYRIYNPIADGKDKLEHVEDMLLHSVERKKLAFGVVLFDSWYATCKDSSGYDYGLNVLFRCGGWLRERHPDYHLPCKESSSWTYAFTAMHAPLQQYAQAFNNLLFPFPSWLGSST